MVTQYDINDIDNEVKTWFRGLTLLIPSLIKQMKTDTKKNRFDLVTNVDQMLESNFEGLLKDLYPDHTLYGEESHHDTTNLKHGYTWVMDPIDGTANLVKQQNDFCIILALFVDGVPTLSYIYDFPRQTLYHAKKDEGAFVNHKRLDPIEPQPLSEMIVSFNNKVLNDTTMHDLLNASFAYRLIGACGLDSIRVCTGQFGAHIHTNAKPWDIAAQFLFASELGLKMTNFNKEAIDFVSGGPFIISNPGCHDEILEILLAKGGYQKSSASQD
ncbi:inositol monophosphatase family protein [Staphylococcus hyicus]|uniref:inositol monophosphatase family protein n=1 Tax=Staphylococcus hyicus TaxID=1284 RepID=UPI00208FB232|nr:inositol monophosphatase family protein [Staphylococcus hyicus]MCO4331057.1 inositol monophosphatase family protein [Staphylococcus hyicus]MCO4333354.1 inositol monophosphatase family protein [Staphylococcus hyicus]